MTEAKQTPLPDLLDRVPDDIVLGIPGDEPVFPSYTNIPIGKLARHAAAELRRLSERMKDLAKVEAQRDALLAELKELTGHANERFSGGVWDRARAAIEKAEGGQ